MAQLILAGQHDPPLRNRNRSALQGLNLCAFASLREIFCAWVAAIPSWPLVIHKCLLVVPADELIPARIRGRIDITINSTYWIGAAVGAAGTYTLLNPALIPVAFGWRAVFLLGALLGTLILVVRHWVPESPRWLTIHGRKQDADAIIKGIEDKISSTKKIPDTPTKSMSIRVRTRTPLNEVWDTVVHRHRSRSCLGFVLMIAQAFFFNAIFFTYSLVAKSFLWRFAV